MKIAIKEALGQLLPLSTLETLVAAAVSEDLGAGDLTSDNAVPAGARARARLVAKQNGVLAGLPIFAHTFTHCDPTCQFTSSKKDGDRIEAGEPIAIVEGNARALLLAERTALNFIQRMSGIASVTARLVELAEGRVRILDTRKTTPGLRAIEKYAVRCGGGENHRFGLYDEVMIKENHIELAGTDVESLTRQVRAAVGPAIRMTVEARDEDEAVAALRGGADVLLLDNMTPAGLAELTPMLRKLAKELGSTVQLEASGGIDASSLAAYSMCGLDRISVGALTHSAPSLDLSLYLDPTS
ncbi:MAG: nicotinate-nucleotide pyrophosphorylase (carboxylating) [Planctomycetota bacterium]|jgi:nicotinate-nucleotide pyrophosphorylase (carboxylating)